MFASAKDGAGESSSAVGKSSTSVLWSPMRHVTTQHVQFRPATLQVRVLVACWCVALLAIGCTQSTSSSSAPAPTALPTPAVGKALDEQTLADQPAETQSIFRGAYGDQAGAAWNAAHDQALIAAMDASARLSASPNPVTTRAWAGTTSVSFDTGGTVGQVYVSINGGPEKLFATAAGGAQDADWIWRGSSYEFRLYAGSHREHLLRTLSVSRADDVTTTVGPLPAVIALALLLAGLVASAMSRCRHALTNQVAGFSAAFLGRMLYGLFALAATASVVFLVLTTNPRPLDQQPAPDSPEYADAARHLVAGDGYVTSVHDNIQQPPRYPPGFSLVLVPFDAFGGSYPSSVLAATPWLAVAYVLTAAVTALVLGGPIAAGIAVALLGTAPFSIESASLLLTDAFAAALTLIAAAMLQRRSFGPAAVAAFILGLLGLIRLSALVAIPALLVSLPRDLSRRVAVFILPGLLAIAIFQWATFGSPLKTGYDYWLPDLKMFDAAYVLERPMGDTPTMVGDRLSGELLMWLCPCPDDGGPLTQLPNVLFYPAVIFGPFWIFTPPLVGVVGLAFALRSWREPAARFTIWLTLLTLAMLIVYVFQAARLAAAPAALLTIYAAVGVARGLNAATARIRHVDHAMRTSGGAKVR